MNLEKIRNIEAEEGRGLKIGDKKVLEEVNTSLHSSIFGRLAGEDIREKLFAIWG